MVTRQTIREFIEHHCTTWGLDPSEVIESRRLNLQEIVLARKALCWLLRERLHLSFPRIGLVLNRDHTTIMHGYRSFQAALNNGECWALELVQRKDCAAWCAEGAA